jgi:hypothetical protein
MPKIQKGKCRNCRIVGKCPEENPEIPVNDILAWLQQNCPQYKKAVLDST